MTTATCECYRLWGANRPIATGDNATWCAAAHYRSNLVTPSRGGFGRQWQGEARELEEFTAEPPEGPSITARVHPLCAAHYRTTSDHDW